MTDLAELLERVKAATEFDTNGGCWLWSGPLIDHPDRMKRPRGVLHILGKRWLAHRLSFFAASGVDPGRQFVCHRCDVSLCVNPDHLYLGDHASNMRDMKSRSRYFAARQPERNAAIFAHTARQQTHSRGAGNPKAKLSAEQAAAIRSDGRKTKTIAAEYGVDRTIIQRIRRGALWTNS